MTERQLDLFRPDPAIPAARNASGRDVWFDQRRRVWTTDERDLSPDTWTPIGAAAASVVGRLTGKDRTKQ